MAAILKIWLQSWIFVVVVDNLIQEIVCDPCVFVASIICIYRSAMQSHCLLTLQIGRYCILVLEQNFCCTLCLLISLLLKVKQN